MLKLKIIFVMKNVVIILIIVCIYSAISGQEPAYYNLLFKKLQAADSIYEEKTYQELSNVCERIIKVTDNEWLPYYYKAYADINLGFMSEDEEEKDVFYDYAQEKVNKAMDIRPDESELYVLQALLYFGRMEIRSMSRVMVYFPKAEASLEKAEALNRNNPRVYYLKGQSMLYKPGFMGGGPEAAKPLLEKALKLFDEYQKPHRVYPSWGLNKTKALYQSCISEP